MLVESLPRIMGSGQIPSTIPVLLLHWLVVQSIGRMQPFLGVVEKLLQREVVPLHLLIH